MLGSSQRNMPASSSHITAPTRYVNICDTVGWKKRMTFSCQYQLRSTIGNAIKLVGDIIIMRGDPVSLPPRPPPPVIVKPNSLSCLMHKSHSTVPWSSSQVTIRMSGKQPADKGRGKHSH